MRRILMAAGMSFGAALPAWSAEIDRQPDPEMGCFATLRGPIERGDADKVAALISEREGLIRFDGTYPREGARLCFDSPGGSLVEGVAIADLLRNAYVGTAVGRGATCESACSVAFMGGFYNSESDVGDEMDRIIHPTARLGFHSPNLTVPEGQYSEAMVNKSYALALQSMGAVVDRMPRLQISIPIIKTMLSTPPEEMTYVETVGQASIFGVAVGPVALPALDAKALQWGCVNVEAQFQAEPPYADGMDYEIPFRSLENADGMVRGVTDGGFRQEAATDCSIDVSAQQDQPSSPVGYVAIGDIRQVYAFQLYPFGTPIAALPMPGAEAPQKAVNVAQGAKAWSYSGTCLVLSGGKIIDQEPCSGQRVTERKADGDHSVDRFTWPSGAVTVVEEINASHPDAQSKLNGTETRRARDTAPDFAPLFPLVVRVMAGKDLAWACWKNPSSGNHFCYVDKDDWGSSQFDLPYSY